MNAEPSFHEQVESILRNRFEGFQSMTDLARLSGGASQETWRIEAVFENGPRRLAMRRAPGGLRPEVAVEGHPGLAAEAELMRVAAAHGVPEPEVYHVLQDEDGIGDGFIMEWLDGETLGARINRSPELAELRTRLAFECGRALARIHGIDVQATGLDQFLDHLPTERFVRQMWERYQEYPTPQPMIDFTARWLLENLPPETEPALVHNDFRNGNVMVNPDGIQAVLDWEVAHLGDPVRDLGWICTNSWRFGNTELEVGGFGTIDDLLAGYESESGRQISREHVHFWIVFGSFWWSVGCLSMAVRYRMGPDRTVERPAIGRRSSECQVDCVNLLIPGPLDVPEAVEDTSTLDMPRVDELLVSVRDFLREDVMAATEGRVNFLARVASNSLDIVLRQQALGSDFRSREETALRQILGGDEDLESLRWKLVYGLRDGSIALDTPGLAEYLRNTVVTQVAIDQPRYTGHTTARRNAEPSPNGG